MLWSLVLLYISGLAAASPFAKRLTETDVLNRVGGRNSALEAQLLDLLESLRQTMLTGSDDIPVLDPLVIDHFTADENLLPLPGLYVTVTDAIVNKLSTFVINELRVERTTLIPLRYRLTVDFDIPVLEVDSKQYELSVPIDGINIFGSGDAKIDIVEPRITGNAIIRPSIGLFSIYIRIESCEFKFGLRDFQPKINGLLGGEGLVNDFINSFLQYLVVDAVKLYEDDITETISSIILDVGNDILGDFNLIGILG